MYVYALSSEVNSEGHTDLRRVVGKQFKPKPGRCVQQRKTEFLRYSGVGVALAGIEYLTEAVINVSSVPGVSGKMHTKPISKNRSTRDWAVEIKPSTSSLACSISQHEGAAWLWQFSCSGVFDESELNCCMESHKSVSGSNSMEGLADRLCAVLFG